MTIGKFAFSLVERYTMTFEKGLLFPETEDENVLIKKICFFCGEADK
jgi:hypothetical protein